MFINEVNTVCYKCNFLLKGKYLSTNVHFKRYFIAHCCNAELIPLCFQYVPMREKSTLWEWMFRLRLGKEMEPWWLVHFQSSLTMAGGWDGTKGVMLYITTSDPAIQEEHTMTWLTDVWDDWMEMFINSTSTLQLWQMKPRICAKLIVNKTQRS